MFKKILQGLIMSLIPACLWAQTKTIRYSNGQKAFEGRMIMAWQELEMKDRLPALPQVNYRKISERDNNELKTLSYLLPNAIYDGKCTFYHQNGQKWFSGKYRYGVKQGQFRYWYANGQLAADQYYKNGMAEGHWQLWDSSGRLQASYHYRPIPDSLLNVMADYINSGLAGSRYAQPKGIDSLFSSFLSRNIKEMLPESLYAIYDNRMRQFQNYCNSNLIQKTYWDGVFEVWKEGRPYMTFSFNRNHPDGTWKIWTEDQLAFELVFRNDTVVSVKDYEDLASNKDYTRLLERQKQYARNPPVAGNNPYAEEPNAIDPGLHPIKTDSQTVYRFVEQQAQFPGGQTALDRFIKTQLHYPAEALKAQIQGRVALEFVITETGKIDTGSIKVVKGVAPALDAEAVRIIKLMPDWTPAQNNGKPVKSYFVIPMTFRIE